MSGIWFSCAWLCLMFTLCLCILSCLLLHLTEKETFKVVLHANAEEPGRIRGGSKNMESCWFWTHCWRPYPDPTRNILTSSEMDFSWRCDTVSALIYLIFAQTPAGTWTAALDPVRSFWVSLHPLCCCFIWNQTQRFPIPLRQRPPCTAALTGRVAPCLSSSCVHMSRVLF